MASLPEPVIKALQEAGINAHFKINQTFSYPIKLGEILDALEKELMPIAISGIVFNFPEKFATLGNTKLTLTEKEVALLSALYMASKPLSKTDLLNLVWNYAPDATTNTLETHIYRLRQKLQENFGKEIIISHNGTYSLKEAE